MGKQTEKEGLKEKRENDDGLLQNIINAVSVTEHQDLKESDGCRRLLEFISNHQNPTKMLTGILYQRHEHTKACQIYRRKPFLPHC